MARPKGDKPAAKKPAKAKNAKAAGTDPNVEAPAAPAQGPQPVHGNTVFTPELGIEICHLISECKTLDEVVVEIGNVVTRRTILRWLAENEEFRKQYARAHEMQGDRDADTIREITRRVIGPLKPDELPIGAQEARIAIDALKWSAGKRKPKVYGDKIDIDTPADGGIAKAVAVTMTALAALAVKKPEAE
jgi:hypothetical protein